MSSINSLPALKNRGVKLLQGRPVLDSIRANTCSISNRSNCGAITAGGFCEDNLAASS